MGKTIISLFKDRVETSDAIKNLVDYGYGADELSIVLKENPQDMVLDDTDTSDFENTLVGAREFWTKWEKVLINGPIVEPFGLSGIRGMVESGLRDKFLSIGNSLKDAKINTDFIYSGGIVIALYVTIAEEDMVKKILEKANALRLEYLDGNIFEKTLFSYYAPLGFKGGEVKKNLGNDKYYDEF